MKSKIYILPQSLLLDMEKAAKHTIVNVKDIMSMVKHRYKGRIAFSKKELQEWIDEKRGTIKSESAAVTPNSQVVVLPPQSDKAMSNSGRNNLDDIPDDIESIDIRNKAQLMEFFQKKLLEKMKLIEGSFEDNNPFVMGIWTQLLKESYTIIEKQIKLQLEIENSSRLDTIVNERMQIVISIFVSAVKKHTESELFDKIKEEIIDALNIYKVPHNIEP